jgi:hypothetical protein
MVKVGSILFLFPLSQFSFGQVDSDSVFLASKGTWKYPNSKCSIHKTGNGPVADPSTGLVFLCDSSYPVKAVFEGMVVLVNEYDSLHMVITRFGSYFIVYSNLEFPQVKKGDTIKTGHTIGRMAKNLDNVYSVEMMLATRDMEYKDLDAWFKKENFF